MVLLLLTGRFYEAKICAILIPLRCAFVWHPFYAEVKFLAENHGLK